MNASTAQILIAFFLGIICTLLLQEIFGRALLKWCVKHRGREHIRSAIKEELDKAIDESEQ